MFDRHEAIGIAFGSTHPTSSCWVGVEAFPDTDAGVIMALKKGKALVAVADYPEAFEVRAFDGPGEDFVTLRDKDHDRHYEEIEGLKTGTTLKLDNVLYQLEQTDNGWALNKKL